jgi:hypothetical protein
MEDYQHECEYETVQACKKFIRDFNDVQIRNVLNPFTNRKIKKGSSTFSSVYLQVRQYLQNLDDEEFHSPLKIENLRVDIVPASQLRMTDPYLSKNVLSTDKIDMNWGETLEKRFKKIGESKEEKVEDFNLSNWKYDGILYIRNDDFEDAKMKWINLNPEVYSFLDSYKPQVFENKYIMNNLICHEYQLDYFSTWLQYIADNYLRKVIDSKYLEKRYPIIMIMLWIYQPFILNARKFLKKKKASIESYLQSKPTNRVKITKQHLESIILAFFIKNTKIENLEKVKVDYETYFTNYLTEAYKFIEEKNILYRSDYGVLFTDYLTSRIRRFRYTSVRFFDLENFDKIVQYLNEPPEKKNYSLENPLEV